MSLVKYASFAVLAVESATGVDLKTPAASLAKQGHRHEFEYDRRPGYIYVRSRAISSRTNDNYDQFPAEEIKKAYRTFVGKPVFVNHHNSDHRRARGVIIDAALHEDMNPDGTPDTWVEVLMEVDAVRFPRLAEAVIKGDIARTSMGTDVAYSVCTACGNKAETPADYCKHIPAMKGMKVRRYNAALGHQEEVLIAEVCYGLGFFENSLLVEDPADPTAYVLGVDGDGLQVAASKTAAGHPVEPVMILRTDRHLHSWECPHCGETGRGLKDPAAAKDNAWAHALVCYDLDWDAEITYRTGREAKKDTTVSPSEHGDPRLQDAGVSVSKTKDGKYYVHTHRARSKYYDSVADIPQKDIDFIRSTGSLTKQADEDQCPYCAGDSLSIGGGHYACQDSGHLWHHSDPAAMRYHGNGPERGRIQPLAGWSEFLDLLRGGRDPRNQCMSCGAAFRWSPALHRFVCPNGHADRPAYASVQAKTYADDDVKTVKDLKKGDPVSWGRHRQFRDADVIEADGDKVRIRTRDKGVEWDIRDDELANFEHRLKRRKKRKSSMERTASDPCIEVYIVEIKPGQWHFWVLDTCLDSEVLQHGGPLPTKEKAWEEATWQWSPTGRTIWNYPDTPWGDDEWLGSIFTRYLGSRRLGYGEVKAPAQVDTLRVDRCPVCHDDESFDGERCAVCGHIEPPAGFGDPDLSKAQQMDLRQDQVEQAADQAAIGDEGAPGLESAGELQCTNCGETFSAEGQPEAGPDDVADEETPADAQPAEAPEDADPEEDDDAEESDDLSDLADLTDEDLDQALEEDEDEDADPEDSAEDTGGVEGEPTGEIGPNMTCPVCGVGTLLPLTSGPQQQEVEPAVVNPDEAAAQIKAHLERILV